ncbi:MAG: SLC13 family permease, partial [Clostridiaceae bacterium]
MEVFKRKIKRAIHYLTVDPVLFAAIVAASVSTLFVPPSKAYFGYLDMRVLCLLFSLMLIVAGLQKVGVFGLAIEHLLKLVHNTRTLAAVLVGICFFSSMLITNDVALITFVPL